MKIYFNGSVLQKQKYETLYQRIINHLHNRQHEVYEKILSQNIPDLPNISTHKIQSWYREWSIYIHQCDFAIIESSYPSTIHVGFEIGAILARGKPVICLFEEGKNPVFIDKIFSTRLVKSEYANDNLEEVLNWCMEEVKELFNKRFTFYISPEIEEFIDLVSNESDISKSEFIRSLIEKEMVNRV